MLLVKPNDQPGSWTYVSLDGLPPLCLSAYYGNHALSPTSGRACLNSKILLSPDQDDQPRALDLEYMMKFNPYLQAVQMLSSPMPSQ